MMRFTAVVVAVFALCLSVSSVALGDVNPTVSTGAATGVDSGNATIAGTVNPNGLQTNYFFDYGTDTNYGGQTPAVDAGSGTADVPVSEVLSGLSPHTTYHYRIGASSDGFTTVVYGADQTFMTDAVPPFLDTYPAVANPVGPAGASLVGYIDPLGSDTTYHFDYGLDTSYGSVTPDAGPLSGQGVQATDPAAGVVSGLVPNTVYHFRVSADNGTGGVQLGADQTFRTGPAAAAAATDITAVKATLSGVVNVHGGSVRYHFEYSGPQGVAATAEVDASPVDGDVAVTATSGVLVPGATYTVKVVMTDIDTGVATSGAEGTFTTDPAPLAGTGAVTGVTPTAATFTGTYDTNGHGGSYRFVIGSSTSAFSATTDPVAITGAGTASGVLDKLPAGQTYKVRLAVTSDGMTTSGDTVTFATPAEPGVTPAAPPAVTSAGPYGCSTPTLAAYDAHPQPGDAITITGSDLGVGGSATLGASPVATSAWSANGLTITLPDDATGSLALTVNCGAVSNTIAVQIYQPPSNTFTATAKAAKTGSTVTVSVKVPGPGTLTVTGNDVKTATKHAKAAGTSTIKATLTAKAVRSLKRHHKLTATISVRFTPTGGTSKTVTKTVAFVRKAHR